MDDIWIGYLLVAAAAGVSPVARDWRKITIRRHFPYSDIVGLWHDAVLWRPGRPD